MAPGSGPMTRLVEEGGGEGELYIEGNICPKCRSGDCHPTVPSRGRSSLEENVQIDGKNFRGLQDLNPKP
jgi:hypothetical protein